MSKAAVTTTTTYKFTLGKKSIELGESEAKSLFEALSKIFGPPPQPIIIKEKIVEREPDNEPWSKPKKWPTLPQYPSIPRDFEEPFRLPEDMWKITCSVKPVNP